MLEVLKEITKASKQHMVTQVAACSPCAPGRIPWVFESDFRAKKGEGRFVQTLAKPQIVEAKFQSPPISLWIKSN